MDTSRISRIETGEITPDAEEVARIGQAIGTGDAKEYAEYFQENGHTIVASNFLFLPTLGGKAKNEFNGEPRAADQRLTDEHGGVNGDVFVPVHG